MSGATVIPIAATASRASRGATGSGEGDERFAVGARGCEHRRPALVGPFDVVDGALVVGVGAVQQSDQDAGVEDQRSHSSRRRSSSPSVVDTRWRCRRGGGPENRERR